MTEAELNEIERAARTAHQRWNSGEVDWLPMMLDLAENRVPQLVEALRLLLAERSGAGRMTLPS